MSSLTYADLDLGLLSPAAERAIAQLAGREDFDGWASAAARVGHCANPVRLHGNSITVDTRTGELRSTYDSTREPLGVLYVRCGNRRTSECPSCSRLYAADTFQMIRSGVVGGKGVPATVSENPLVFATLTAPSFGAVHRSGDQVCRPRRRSERCAHGHAHGCHQRHSEDDPRVGQPICVDCYDYDSHVVWQWWAPELWRRFTIGLRRSIAQALGVTASRLRDVATLQYAKVAEFQRRGVIHFHALFRLDGPRSPEGFAPAPPQLDARALGRLIRDAARRTVLHVPVPGRPARVLAFGHQLDARPVAPTRREGLDSDSLAGEQVAGYLAKYATKSAGDSVGDIASNAHALVLRHTAMIIAREAADEAESPYELLGRWADMLGFRGHFSTKSRRYSVTLGRLRRARRRWQAISAESRRGGVPIDPAELEELLMRDDEDETVLVIGHWAYAGTGWRNEGEVALAKAAAAYAQGYARARAAERKNT